MLTGTNSEGHQADCAALEVYRRALAIYPRLQRIPEVVKTPREKVEGRDISGGRPNAPEFICIADVAGRRSTGQC